MYFAQSSFGICEWCGLARSQLEHHHLFLLASFFPLLKLLLFCAFNFLQYIRYHFRENKSLYFLFTRYVSKYREKGNFISFFLSPTSNIKYFSVPCLCVTQDLRRVKHCGIKNNNNNNNNNNKIALRGCDVRFMKNQNQISTFKNVIKYENSIF